MSNKHIIPASILFGGAIVGLAIYFSVPKHSNDSGTGNPALVRPVDANDHIFGNPLAPVKIVEYADFDCEYCKGFDETMHQIIANEGAKGDVAWVYREFPLIEIHPNALHHAEAAECVGQVAGNDTFWKFKSELFANQPVDPSEYGTLAKKAGVSGDDFATCFSNASTTVDSRINADRANAFAVGAQGTPYSLILVANQAPIVLNGGYSYAALKEQVDAVLQGVR